jgi:hypothetical protein
MTVRKAFSRYRAAFIPDPRNAVGVPENTQILIIDEVDWKHKPDLSNLKCLTSGDASSGSLNRKSYGRSYIPNEDVQIIILSNWSPWCVYAKYDASTKRRIASSADVMPIQTRFEIHRLDGEDDLEMFAWLDPADMTDEQFRRKIQEEFYSKLRYENSTGNVNTFQVKQVLCDLYRLVQKRVGGAKITYNSVMNELDKALHNDDYRIVREVCNR